MASTELAKPARGSPALAGLNEPFRLHLPPAVRLSPPQFLALCAANHPWQLEYTAEGDILIMPPEGGESGHRSFSIGGQLAMWAARNRTGKGFGSSAGFVLPDGSVLSPDASWIRSERLKGLTPQQKREFLPLCPDFVIEVRSRTDSLRRLKAKMEQYVANGAQLGWLINPNQREVWVYRPGQPVEILAEPDSVSADPLLPGFTLELGEVWEPGL